METTPCPVRPYAISMLFCVVVSTAAIKTQADFASREIFHSDFNSDSADALSVELVQNVIHYSSISFAHPDWTFIHRHLLSKFGKDQTTISMPGQMINTIDYLDRPYPLRRSKANGKGYSMLLKNDVNIELKLQVTDKNESDSTHIL